MKKILNFKLIDKVFLVEIIVFTLIITGFLPRQFALYLAVGLVIYVTMTTIENATLFFIRSIPLFMAIPIMATYDSLNIWRILSIILFLKLAHVTGLMYFLKIHTFSRYSKLLVALLFLAVISLIPAIDKGAAVKKIIYFINISLPGIVIYHLIRKNKFFAEKLIKNIAIPTIIVIAVGFIQLASTYFIDVYQFMALWGERIQLNQFGTIWSEIAVRLGNTWLAYYGPQLSLRVFSLFPDSHSFPQFVLLGLPALFAISILKLAKDPEKYNSLKKMVTTRVSMNIIWVTAALLIVILSGTRGIWAASVGVIIIALFVIFWTRKDAVVNYKKNIFKYISLYLVVFYLLFTVAWPVFISPQFLLSKGNLGLFGNRIKSIIDFGETSNSQRIDIWKKTFESIKERPLLGVGIGNYPVILDQDVFLSRAGSSAHNIYLHIAAVMGIPALVIALWFLWLLFRKTYINFIHSKNPLLTIYFAALLLFVPWVLIYSLTDVALFDGRAFLLFVVTTAIILGIKNPD